LAAAAERWEQQDLQGCRQQLDSLLARNPKHRDAQLLLADVLLASDRSKEALEHLEKLAEANPKDADVQYALGLTLDANGQSAKALPHYEQAANLAPNSEVYAVSYRNASESAERPAPPASPTTPVRPVSKGPGNKVDSPNGTDSTAGAALSDCTEKNSTKTLLCKGEALMHSAPGEAKHYFRQAAAAEPDNPQIPISAAMAALRANQSQAAVAVLEDAVKRPKAPAAVHRILGVAYYRLGDYPSSQRALRQALSLDKSDALAYFLMGSVMAKLGQPEAAESHFRQAEALDPRYAAR
jgi:tetratricopeptide (TPR) repeat protein